MGDKIDKLPTDTNSAPSKSDMDIISNLFKNKEIAGKVAYEFKDSVVGGILFLALSSPMADKIIRSSGCENEFYIWGIKFLLFVIVFYILKNRT